jgi:uncharacterized protein (TIGR03067 family)
MQMWTMTVAILVGAPALKDRQKPVDPPGDLWTILRVEREGERWDNEGVWARKAMRFTAKACQFEARGRLVLSEPAIYFLSRGMQQMDFYPADPERRRQAIWKLEGDTLTLCEGPPGGPRPTEFRAPAKEPRHNILSESGIDIGTWIKQ